MSAITMSFGIGGVRLPEKVSLALLVTPPQVLGLVRETDAVMADFSDVWTRDGQPVEVVDRQYRLNIGGTIVDGPQADPSVMVPAGTGGQSYTYQLRVTVAGATSMFSDWVTLASGTVAYAPPAIVGILPDAMLTANDPALVIDLAGYFSGTNLAYTLVSGALPVPSTLVGSTLTLAGTEPFGPQAIVLRASNPAGDADQSFQLSIAPDVAVPGAFGPADWSVSPASGPDVVDLTVSSLPPDGGAAITSIEISLDGGPFTAIGGVVPGVYTVPAPGAGQTYQVVLRAVNSSGTGPVGDIKTVTTATGPASFDITSTANSEIQLDGVTDTVTVTITAPAQYASYDAGNGPGVFVFDSAALASGPVLFVPVRLTATGATAGDSLDLIPGLSAYDSDNPAPTVTYAWLRNGVIIPGETGSSYLVRSEDAGTDIAVRETVTGTNGTAVSTAVPVGVAQSAAAITIIDADTSGIGITYTGALTITGSPAGFDLEAA